MLYPNRNPGYVFCKLLSMSTTDVAVTADDLTKITCSGLSSFVNCIRNSPIVLY